jgi:HAD superfamily hydrolase (TIGR01450 family)
MACITNSTSSPRRLVKRLAHMGVELRDDDVYTAAAAAADYVLDAMGPRPRVFNLATEGLHELLDGKVEWVIPPPPAAHDPAAYRPCDAVVVGAPANVYATDDRQRAALYYCRGGAALIGICADRVYPSPRGLEFGSGALTHFLAYAAGARPFFTGKPQPIFFQELCRKLGVEPSRCLLIGDNLEADIAGAKALGMETILTLSGVTCNDDLRDLDDAHRPHAVIRDLRDL